MITQNTIRFKCPIEDIPTKDDVLVSLDLGINFHIGTREKQDSKALEQDIFKFYYNFGPNRLEELLQQEADEAMRNLLRSVKSNKVRDLESGMLTTVRQILAEKFQIYGVIIEQVNIMTIIIPKTMRMNLSQTTQYDVMLQF